MRFISYFKLKAQNAWERVRHSRRSAEMRDLAAFEAYLVEHQTELGIVPVRTNERGVIVWTWAEEDS